MTNTFSGAKRLIELDIEMVSLPHATTNVGPSLESSKLYLNHAPHKTLAQCIDMCAERERKRESSLVKSFTCKGGDLSRISF